MNFDLNWLPAVLLGLPIAFALGWMASRLDWRQLRLEDRRNPRAYFRGLNYLLNEQQDQAIDAFIEAVQNDPDTSELHFALGNLFRRRGEYERAVRVHQHLLERGDLEETERQRAQHALALDYLKAGLLDRADAALLALEDTPFQTQARQARLANAERSRDWKQAATIARQLEEAGKKSKGDKLGSFAPRLAHYLCEQAAAQLARQDKAAALELLQQAVQTAPAATPAAARARIALAKLQWQPGQESTEGATAACAMLEEALELCPAQAPLIAPLLAQAALAAGRAEPVYERLQTLYQSAPSLDVIETLATLDAALHPGSDGVQKARTVYLGHLEREPSLVAASKWLASEKFEHEDAHPAIQRALDRAAQPLMRYRCAACGFETRQHFWQCPGCQAWDSYPARRVEEL